MKVKYKGEIVDVSDKYCTKKQCFVVQRKVLPTSNGKPLYSCICHTREIKGCPDE